MSFLSDKATLIYNPIAGFGEWQGIVASMSDFWRRHGWEVILQPTQRGGHATELARAAADAGHGLVLAAGGDGTLNEVANGLAESETILAPLPVGTSNSFAKELGMPRPTLLNLDWLTDASNSLVRGRIQAMDLGKCENGRYWLLWASTGADGFLVEQIEPRSRLFKRFGSAGYAVKAMWELPKFSGMRATVQVDDERVQGDFVQVTAINCRMAAGGELRLNARGVLDDGKFEVWCFHGKQWPEVMQYIVEVGLENHMNNPNIDILRGRSMEVQTEPPMPFQLDGEPTGTTPLRCTIQPSALRLLMPDTAPVDLFQEIGERARM